MLPDLLTAEDIKSKIASMDAIPWQGKGYYIWDSSDRLWHFYAMEESPDAR